MESSSKGLLTQVTQFWNLLDDLAESNPESYEKFIQQQLKEGKQLCAAPEPQLCLQTRILVCSVGTEGWEVLSERILEKSDNHLPLAIATLRKLEGNCHSKGSVKQCEDYVEGVRMGNSHLIYFGDLKFIFY